MGSRIFQLSRSTAASSAFSATASARRWSLPTITRAVVGNYLSYLEQDQREPSLSIAARIARELEIPLDELASALSQ
jgi:transcriptional regulator with XRE-family HTH domain